MKKSAKALSITFPSFSSSKQRLFWIWTDSGGFPRSRLSAKDEMAYTPQPIKEFEDEILDASERIWILDPHFSEQYGLSALWLPLCLTRATDIRVISHARRPDAWILKQKEETGYSPSQEIQWNICFHELHDRFALLDRELWHFGSTVGGAYPGFGAVTRGWSTEHIDRIFLSRWDRL